MSTIQVAAGDTLSSLAKKHGVTVAALKAANGLGSSLIQVGQRLVLPGTVTLPMAAPATAGAFAEIPVVDSTATYGALAVGPLAASAVNSVVLHRTGGSAAGALATYAKRIKAGSTIGAHYLIDEMGAVILTVPIDRKVSHVGSPKPGFAGSGNSHAVGIEHAGKPLELALPASAKDAAGLQANRNSIARMDLAPRLRQRLLGLSDGQLFKVARDNRDPESGKWQLYGDLDPPQRRASFVLAAALLDHFGRAEEDLLAHETVAAKNIGEGENIKEFLTDRFAYPGLVRRLATLAAGNAALDALVAEEEDLVAALDADATAQEAAALAGGDAAAEKRQATREAFYQKFWKRSAQLADLVELLNAGPADPPKLAAKLAAWAR